MTDEPVRHDVAAAVADVRARIDRARTAAGRDDEVRLVAISKTHAPPAMRAAVAAGVADLGENRVAEFVAKHDALADELEVGWHFVGQLQSRKATSLVGRDVLVHSVDRRSLVDRFERLAGASDVVQRVLVQVNVGEDPAKAGCDVREAQTLVAYAARQPHLEVQGLMTIPPLAASRDGTAGIHFARLRALRDELAVDWPSVRHLSMGMSADLEDAVAEGATMVRVGTDVFGPRGAGPWRPDVPASTKDAT